MPFYKEWLPQFLKIKKFSYKRDVLELAKLNKKFQTTTAFMKVLNEKFTCYCNDVIIFPFFQSRISSHCVLRHIMKLMSAFD